MLWAGLYFNIFRQFAGASFCQQRETTTLICHLDPQGENYFTYEKYYSIYKVLVWWGGLFSVPPNRAVVRKFEQFSIMSKELVLRSFTSQRRQLTNFLF